MTRKLLSLLLVLACLLPCMILPLSAAGSTGLKDFSTTTVDSDLIGTKYKNKLGATVRIEDAEHINTLFPAKSGGEASILEVMEMGYSSTAGSGSSITLYVWVYIPDTTLNVDSEYNMITLADKYDTDPLDEGKTQAADKWTATQYSRYAMKHLGTSSGGTVHKFAVKGFNAAGCIYGGQRRYNISRLDLHYAGEAEARNYTHGRTYICTGTHTDGTYKAAVDGLDVIEITDLYQTTFRYNNLEDEGEIQRATQINSVYFSIPKEYEEKYDQLFSIRYDCYRYRSTPMIVTVEEELFKEYSQWILKRLNVSGMSEKPDSSLYMLRSRDFVYDTPNSGHYDYVYDWSYNAKTEEDSDLLIHIKANSSSRVINPLFWLFGYKGEDQTWGNDSIENAVIPAKAVLAHYAQYVNAEYSTRPDVMYMNGLIQDKFSGDYGFINNTIFASDKEDKNLQGYEYSSGWSEFWAKVFGELKDTEDITDVNSIQKIYKEDYDDFIAGNSDATICKKYLVDKADIADFKEFCRETTDDGNTVVVMHFASSEYEVYDAVSYYTGITGMGTEGRIVWGGVYACIQDLFLNFTIIEMTFGDEFEQTTIPTNAPNINIMGGLTPGGSNMSSVPKDDDGPNFILILLSIIGAILLIWGISVLLKPVTALGNAAGRSADNARLRRSIERDKQNPGSNINIYIDGKKTRTYTDKPKPKKTNHKGKWK